jgi:hypothetical protein
MSSSVAFDSEGAREAAFRRAIVAQLNDDDCRDCRDRLDAYIAAQLAGDDYLVQFPAVAAHLDMCADCAEIYAHLYELEAASQGGALPAAVPARRPDLSFLRRETAAPQTTASLLSDLLQRTGDQLQLRLSAALLALLQPAPALAVTRAAAAKLIYRLEAEEAGVPDLPLSLAIYEELDQPSRCLVEVTVTPPGKSWPDLGGREVVMEVHGEVRRGITDSWGVVVFAGVPRDGLETVAFAVSGV